MLTEIQQIILTCLLGPEDKTAFKKFKKASRERERREQDPTVALRAKELDLERRAADPEKYREQDRVKVEKHRRLNPRAAAEAAQRYRENHQDRANKSNQKSRKNRYHINPQFRLSVTLRNSLGRALRQSKAKKSLATFDLLGCPLVWFETYLEEQFKPGMTWENHGPVWHVDHVKPIASFDLTDPEQQRICFHWTNFQPLFARENIQKSDKYVL